MGGRLQRVTVSLTQAEANVLNAGAAELAAQLESGDLDGVYSTQKLNAMARSVESARRKLFSAGMKVL